MYGLVNVALERMILARGGQATWEHVCARARVDIEGFVGMRPYPDEVTVRLVTAAAEVLGESPEAVMEAFGEGWISFAVDSGYRDYLALAGPTVLDVLANVDALHTRIQLVFREFRMPRFEVTERDATSLRLHYRSQRDGLAPFVAGLVRGLGRHFSTPVQVKQLAWKGRDGRDHDEFLVSVEG